MNANFRNYYRSPKGNMVFVYAVTGTEKEIKDYVSTQGENVRFENEGDPKSAPLFFTVRPTSKSVTLIKTTSRNSGEMRYQIDDSAIALELAIQATHNSIAKQAEAQVSPTAVGSPATSVSREPANLEG